MLKTRLTFIICSVALLQFIACTGVMNAQAGPDLGEIARQTREKRQTAAPTRPEIKQLIEEMSAASEDQASEDQYKREMQDLLEQRKFAALDAAAHEARSTKARFPGGIWKLYALYNALAAPSSGDSAGEAELNAHLVVLKSWVADRPQSITARVALAQATIDWGWKARGHGFAGTVTDRGWDQMGERVEQARIILMNAAGLPEKCPYWFEAMQHVALAQGWDKSRARALLDQAVSFEPGFYHFYREYVNFVLPRWYGRDGEAEEFVDNVSRSVGGQEGAFLYFELSTVINCNCSADNHVSRTSWERTKQGYAAMEQLYGTSTLKMNRLAYMAYINKDYAAAHQTFTQLGNSWDKKTWGTRQLFDMARAWAMSDAGPQGRLSADPAQR